MGHVFDRVCDENGIEHRLTQVNHPWTNGHTKLENTVRYLGIQVDDALALLEQTGL